MEWFFGTFMIGTPIVLFAYSGLFKWLPFPIDTTLLFGLILASVLISCLLKNGIGLRKGVFHVFFFILAFFGWYLITALYSVSPDYWRYKSLLQFANIFTFVFPILFFNTLAQFRQYENTIVAISLGAVVAVWYFFFTDNLDFLIRQGFDKEFSKIPDYLSIGSPIALGTLILVSRSTPTSIAVAAVNVGALAMIGARGPFLFLLLTILMGVVLWYRRIGNLIKRYFVTGITTISIGLTVFGMMQYDGFTLMFERLSVLVTDERTLEASGREEAFETAFHVILEDFLLGTGIGGYGISEYRIDENVYPHNLFLEAWAEAGIIGLMLFSIGVFSLLVQAKSRFYTKTSILYFIMFLFIFLNYMKSGGFIGARDLCMSMSVLLVFIHSPLNSTSMSDGSGQLTTSLKT